MPLERRKLVEEIFSSALDLAAEKREAFLEERCALDQSLYTEVKVLIAQHEAPSGSQSKLDSTTAAPTQLLDADANPVIGQRIGAYRIVREIGCGGMGAVYIAVRADSEYHKRVAVKLIKRGMDTDFILSRFRNERQILVSLDHQNIARLLDGGTTVDGLPYFVMEYIEGQPLYEYCDHRKLTIRERLQLFCQAGAALSYAHQKLFIHRDIKPSNILVTAGGELKLLDFGIAKLLDPELAIDSLVPTATAMRLMTPEYASPEQAQGSAASQASDIYSFGVLLYELLTGHRPYHLRQRAPHEIAQVISQQEPTPPSEVVAQPAGLIGDNEVATLELLSSRRGASLEALRRELSGDLDNIVFKALNKEPMRRYSSVESFCEDISSK